MKLVILGTAGYHPNDDRQTTCVLIPEAGIVFDAGTAMYRLPQHLQTEELDIFISHAHLDHVVGLTYLLDILYQYPLKTVRVHGEEAKLNAVREHLFAEPLFPVEPPFVSVPLNGTVGLKNCKVSYCELQHPGGAVGFRVDWEDRSLAVITDTTAAKDAEYVNFVQGVDLLLHECNFGDDSDEFAHKTGHSCLTPVAEVARKAEVGGLVLFHFNPIVSGVDKAELNRVASIFSPIVLAEDRMEIEF